MNKVPRRTGNRMTIKKFLELAPGPQALQGAVVLLDDLRAVGRVDNVHGFLKKHSPFSEIIELPPMYLDPKARYCAWCRAPLGSGYSIQYGLEGGYCPTHGRAAPVLHQASPEPKEPEVKPEPAIALPGPTRPQTSSPVMIGVNTEVSGTVSVNYVSVVPSSTTSITFTLPDVMASVSTGSSVVEVK